MHTITRLHTHKHTHCSVYSDRPYLIVSGEDRYNSAESSNNFKISKNDADAHQTDGVGSDGGKSALLLTSKHRTTDATGGEDDDEEIKGDASGITVPLSKSLGKCDSSSSAIIHHWWALCDCDISIELSLFIV